MANLSQLVHVDCSLSIHAALHDVGELLLVRESLPALTDKGLSLLAFLLREHLLDDGHFFSAIEPICGQELEFARGLDGLVVTAELDAVDLFPKLVDAVLHLFYLLEVVLLTLVC